MLSVLADRTYRHLFAAQIIALVGTGMMTLRSVCWPSRLRVTRRAAGTPADPSGTVAPT